MKSLRSNYSLLLSCLFAGLLSATASPVALVPANAVWKYLANGTDQGTAWRAPGFDDSAWPSGPAQLGYGDGDEATVIAIASPAPPATVYFRRSVFIPGGTDLILRLLRDDGAIVYFNGVEVRRDNMPSGPVTAQTLATVTVGGADESTFFESIIPASAITPGTNVIAVEVHQSSLTSSDLSFALELIANFSSPGPVVTVTATDSEAREIPPWLDIPENPAVFRISRTGNTSNALPVNIRMSGTASNGADYETVSNIVTIPAGSAFTDVFIHAFYDNQVEGTESVVLSLVPTPCLECYVTGSNSTATAYILDSGTTNLPPTVWISHPQDGAIFTAPVDILLRAVAQDPEDGYEITVEFFEGTNKIGNATFLPTLCPAADCPSWDLIWSNVPPGAYTLTAKATDKNGAVTVSAPVHITVNSGEGERTVVNVVTLDSQADESGSRPDPNPGLFAIRRSGNLTASIPVYFTLSGTAANGADYAFISNRVVIAAGSTQALIYVNPLNDEFVEPTETVILTIDPVACVATVPTPPECYLVGPSNRATVFIGDATSTNPPPPAITLIATGSVWKYNDQCVDLGREWRSLPYFDGPWASGPAQLGYGDGDEATVIGFGPDSTAKCITTYFRRTFSLANPLNISRLRARLLEDDGAIVYLNGIEVFRSNMPEGNISFNTLATTAAENQIVEFSVPPDLLLNRNVLAVEMHQVNAASSDLSFDLELIGDVSPSNGPPRIVIVTPNDGDSFLAGTSIFLGADPFSDGVQRVDFYSDNAFIGRGIGPLPSHIAAYGLTWSNPPVGAHILTAVVTDSAGAQGTSAPVHITIIGNGGTNNLPPIVTILTPTNGQSFSAGANILLGANATDDGSVQSVQFFAGSLNLGFAEGPLRTPYGEWPLTWSNAPAGTYALRAVATDDRGARETSAPVNITIVGSGGTNFPIVRVFATDANAAETPTPSGDTGRFTFTRTGGSITNPLPVYFMISGTASNGVDYLFVTNRIVIPPGMSNADLVITPIDDAQPETVETVVVQLLAPPTSPDSRPYQVGSPSVATVFIHDNDVNTNNAPPVAYWLAPPSGSVFTQGMNILLRASASDADGSVSRVEFRRGTDLIGIATTPVGTNYTFMWSNPPIGSHILRAVAVDNLNARGTSGPINITVRAPTNVPPVVTITSPTNGSVLARGVTIGIIVQAQDSDGGPVLGEIFDGTNKLAEGAFIDIGPYIACPAEDPDSCPRPVWVFFFSWSNAPVGLHTLTARATDNDGARGTSAPVNITVEGSSSSNRELHVVGIYSGSYNGGSSPNHERGDASVIVDRPGKSVTLYLSAYEPVLWHVSVASNTIIERVFLAGYYQQDITGISPETPLIRTNQYVGYTLDCAEFYLSAPAVRRLTGMEISSFHGSYTATETFVIADVQDDPRLRSDFPQPVDASGVPSLNFRLAFHQRDSGNGNVFFREYSLQGPVGAADVIPAMRVFADPAGRYYYGAQNHEVWRIDTQANAESQMQLPPSLPAFSWAWSGAYDTQRNRFLVVSFGGEGYLYAYSPPTGEWSVVRSMNNLDLGTLVYHAATDQLFGLSVMFSECDRPVLYRLTANGEVLDQMPLAIVPFGRYGARAEMVSVGDYLVLLLEASNYGDADDSRIYLIDPRTGHLWLTYRSGAVQDSDHDGVPDDRDQCPNTPPGVTVDEHGCSADQRDSDHDGVPDSRDECPNTPAGEIVDEHGCSIHQQNPIVLTFDELSPGSNDAWVPVGNGYGGLQWNNFGAINGLLRPANEGYHAGVVSASNVAFNLYGDPASIYSVVPFDFKSAYLTAAINLPDWTIQLAVQGFVGTTLVYDRTVVVSNNSPAWIEFNYRGVNQVRFVPSQHSTWFALDNLAIVMRGATDTDGDGVPDSLDQCPNTRAGAAVDEHGCSIAQLCPCEGRWTNHTAYVECVRATSQRFLDAGWITSSQRDGIVEDAQHSDCGIHPRLIVTTRSWEEFRTNGCRLILYGEGPTTCVIECSTNLLNWVPIGTNTVSGTEIQIDDRDAYRSPHRFYRLRY